MTTYTPFPVSSSQLVVPAGDRGAAVAGIAMYAPCQRRSVVVRDVLWWGVRLLGPRVLPGAPVTWPMPVTRDVWDEICGDLRSVVPAWDAIAVYRRPADRPGATVAFIVEGRQVAIARIEPDHEHGVATEVAALRTVAGTTPDTFVVPEVRAVGARAGWTWAVLSPLRLLRHRMVTGPQVVAIAEEVGTALTGLPRPAGTPAGWRPCHGDFVPWNLRTGQTGRPALLDWESVGWAPPGADLALYHLSASAVGRNAGVPWDPTPDVLQFWHDAIAARIAGAHGRDVQPDPLNRRILALLEQPARSGA